MSLNKLILKPHHMYHADGKLWESDGTDLFRISDRKSAREVYSLKELAELNWKEVYVVDSEELTYAEIGKALINFFETVENPIISFDYSPWETAYIKNVMDLVGYNESLKATNQATVQEYNANMPVEDIARIISNTFINQGE